MAIILANGAENGGGANAGSGAIDAGQDGGGIIGVFGTTTPVVSSAQKNTGTYSFRTQATTTGNSYISFGKYGATGRAASIAGTGSIWWQAFLRIATLPGSGTEPIFACMNTSAGFMGNIRVASTGVLSMYNSANTLVATGSTALSTNTWYRLEGIVTKGTSATMEVKINGTVEITSATVNQTNININDIQFGKIFNASSQTVDFYWDDIALDDAAYVGGYQVYPCPPNGNSSPHQWTAGTGTSGFGEIDETPFNDSDYVANVSLNDESLFTNDISLVPTNVDIKAVTVSARVREATSTTSALKPRIVSNSVTSELGTGFNAGTTTAECDHLTLVDPNTSAAWTRAALSSAVVGVKETAASGVAMRCTRLSTYVLAAEVPPSFKVGLLGCLGCGH